MGRCRASTFKSDCQEFESRRARQLSQRLRLDFSSSYSLSSLLFRSVLQPAAIGYLGCGDLPSGGEQPGDILQLEEEIRRAAADGDEAAEPVGGRERQAQEAGRRPVARQEDASGRYLPKCMVRSVRARLLGLETSTVCLNVSGLSRVGCCCSQAMMRYARAVPG